MTMTLLCSENDLATNRRQTSIWNNDALYYWHKYESLSLKELKIRDDVIERNALLAIRTGNSPVTGEFLAQRPVTRSFDAFFDLTVE